MHSPVVVAPRGDQPGVVDAGVRLAGTRAGHYDSVMPIMHEPCVQDGHPVTDHSQLL
ncbi:MAG TPA: hypothetical protein VFB58_01185 [Chloroflexota bacterium]|nr:hypothetical protein [Chloroflexota bacterium]